MEQMLFNVSITSLLFCFLKSFSGVHAICYVLEKESGEWWKITSIRTVSVDLSVSTSEPLSLKEEIIFLNVSWDSSRSIVNKVKKWILMVFESTLVEFFSNIRNKVGFVT